MSPLSRELIRKSVHLLQLPIIAAYSVTQYYFSSQTATLGLTALLLLLLEFEYIRIDYQTKLGSRLTDFFSRIFILRKHEKNNVTGAIFFTMSTIIAFSSFDYTIALLALLMAIFGDFAAAVAGITFGKKKIFRNKSYVGCLTGLFVNITMGAFVLPGFSSLYLPMAVTATVVEGLTQKLDDNLTVPLFSGFIGQLAVYWFHISLPSFF